MDWILGIAALAYAVVASVAAAGVFASPPAAALGRWPRMWPLVVILACLAWPASVVVALWSRWRWRRIVRGMESPRAPRLLNAEERRALLAWTETGTGRAFLERFPAERARVTLQAEALTWAGGEGVGMCGCGAFDGDIRFYTSPGEYVSVCRKCGSWGIFEAKWDPR